MEPLSAIPLAFLLLDEMPSLIAMVGGVLILASGYLVVRRGGGGEQMSSS
jgi:drug/metabolite transporter (DMT)-like permease